MKLLSFLSSSDTPDLVHKAIKHQTDWLDSLSNASYFDAGEAGERKTWADCEKLGCFGGNEAAQKPLPETHIQEFLNAQNTHLAVHTEIEEEHPLIWMFWGENSSSQAVEELITCLSSLDRCGTAMISEEAALATLNMGGNSQLQSEIGPLHYAEEISDYMNRSIPTGSFGLAGDRVGLSLNLERRDQNGLLFTAELTNGDPGQLAATIQAAMHMEDEDLSAVKETLEYLASRLKSSMEEIDNAQAALQEQLNQAMELQIATQRSDDEDRDRERGEQGSATISSLI